MPISANENTIEFLKAFGDKVVERAQAELRVKRRRYRYSYSKSRKGRVGTYTGKIDNTGKLRKSLSYTINKKKGRVQFYMEEYGQWVDLGRGRTQSSSGGQLPKAIRSWIRSKPLRLRDENGQFIKATDQTIKAATYLIMRKLRYFGIDPTYFFQDPFDEAIGRAPEGLTPHMVKDIEEHIAFKAEQAGLKVEDK